MNDVFGFTGCTVALALDDLAREDDVFKVEDGEVVIFKFVRGMGGNDVAERTDQMAKVGDGHLGHAKVYERPISADGSADGRILSSGGWIGDGARFRGPTPKLSRRQPAPAG